MISNFVNTYFTYRLLKIVAQPWTSTPAFLNGVIDADGNRLSTASPDKVSKYYSVFDRVAYNIKRTVAKVPGSQNPFARFATAVALMREGALMESDVEELVNNLDPVDEETPTNTVGSGAVAIVDKPFLKKPLKRKKLSEAINLGK